MGKKILIVDDEEILCELLSETLEADGHMVTKVYDGQDAIDMLQDNEYDAAIIDLYLPQKSGIEVLQFIHDNHKNVKVIMASGYSEIPVAAEAMKLGALEFLLKPFNLKMLKESLERIFTRDSMPPGSFDSIYKTNTLNPTKERNSYNSKIILEETGDNTFNGSDDNLNFSASEKEHLLTALKDTNWNKSKTAENLGISLKSLHAKIREYGIES